MIRPNRLEADVAESIDVVLAYWKEHREQLRQCENQRAVLTNYILVLATASTGLIVQQKFTDRTVPLALFLIGLGLYGAATTAKYHERAEYHLSQARALTQTLIGLGALGDDTLLNDYRQTHATKFPRLSRIRLHWLWTGLHLIMASYGTALTIAILVRSR
jgi:hypothetical protein